MIPERGKEINRRRHRREKMRKLKAKLASVNSSSERERIIQKIRRLSPNSPLSKGK